jgi:hypothetical protein
MRSEAMLRVWGLSFAAVAKQLEHGGAAVDGVGCQSRILRKQSGQKTAVAIAQDKRAVAAGELRQEMEPAAFENAAERQVFEPAVGARDAIEIGTNYQASSSEERVCIAEALFQARNSTAAEAGRESAGRDRRRP